MNLINNLQKTFDWRINFTLNQKFILVKRTLRE